MYSTRQISILCHCAHQENVHSAADVAFAALGTTQLNASRWTDRVALNATSHLEVATAIHF